MQSLSFGRDSLIELCTWREWCWPARRARFAAVAHLLGVQPLVPKTVVIQMSISLEYELASEPLHTSVPIGIVLNRRTTSLQPARDFIRTSMYDAYSGLIKINVRLEHTSHGRSAPGTTWSNGWTYRVFIINTRND